MIKYTRTQVFKAINYGDPFIRPVFYEFPGDPKVYPDQTTQFMYGPSFFATIKDETTVIQTYLAAGTWCPPSY